MLRIKRKHWQIEMHFYQKDEAFGEDRCTARAGNGARVLSSLRNLALGILRLLDVTKIKRTLDHFKRRPRTVLELLRVVAESKFKEIL